MEKSVRRWIAPVHGILGKIFPVLGWVRESWLHASFLGCPPLCPLATLTAGLADARHVEMIFGVATALNFCRGGELGQCAAHYIMGSAFIGYAVILVIMLQLGHGWLARRGCSQEMLDSSVITAWVSVASYFRHALKLARL